GVRREKLLTGLRKACEKRQIGVAELTAVATEIEARIASDPRPEVPSAVIGELAMDALRRLDHIAYIRFASVYRAFSDMESLKEAIAAVEEGRVPGADDNSLQLPLPAENETRDKPRLVGRRTDSGSDGVAGVSA
ncbi:MAG: ATP cone domain-containing protein, partial [Dehalococcoidia bacterium]